MIAMTKIMRNKIIPSINVSALKITPTRMAIIPTLPVIPKLGIKISRIKKAMPIKIRIMGSACIKSLLCYDILLLY
jgi:hypothetical protein